MVTEMEVAKLETQKNIARQLKRIADSLEYLAKAYEQEALNDDYKDTLSGSYLDETKKGGWIKP